ncbi:MAG TPA: tyrosine--tRNA ligase [bacterium]|nr:tyrosine--tRNA ligase [bacterium]
MSAMNNRLSAPEQLDRLLDGTAEVISKAELLEKLKACEKEARPLKVKWGADPSAPDIHLGHTVVLRKLRQFQDLGHKVQFLIGDFTAMIGDPTGKSATRKPLSREEVDANAKTYLEQVFKVLDEDPAKIEVRRNSEWCRPMAFEDVIRLASKYTVARILERDDFTNRMKEQKPISLHELLYPLIQGYDSVMLQSDVEMCGTDQKFNCLVGRALQQEVGQSPEVILAMPILEGLDGVKKMSKSLGNYVGVTDPPNEMFAKLMSVSDELMWRYYRLLSSKGPEWEALKGAVEKGEKHPKTTKMELAAEITGRFYGEAKAKEAWDYFENRHQLSGEVDYPKVSVEAGSYKAADFMLRVGISKTKSDAKRLIEQGAVEWVDARQQKRKIASFADPIELAPGETGLIRSGKVFLKIIAD